MLKSQKNVSLQLCQLKEQKLMAIDTNLTTLHHLANRINISWLAH